MSSLSSNKVNNKGSDKKWNLFFFLIFVGKFISQCLRFKHSLCYIIYHFSRFLHLQYYGDYVRSSKKSVTKSYPHLQIHDSSMIKSHEVNTTKKGHKHYNDTLYNITNICNSNMSMLTTCNWRLLFKALLCLFLITPCLLTRFVPLVKTVLQHERSSQVSKFYASL